jgi:hypothetical protein
MMAGRRHAARAAGFVRTLLAWLVVCAMVISPTFSFEAHAHDPGHGTAAIHAPSPDGGAPDDPLPGDAACHCSCQHFSGMIAVAEVLPDSDTPLAREAAIPPAVVASPPIAPHRPPIA